MAPLFVATFLTRLSAPPAQSMLAFHSSGLCLAHVGPWLCFLSGRVDEAHRALHGSGERAPVEAEMSTDSFHLYGTSGLSIRELSPCWSVQGAGGVLIQLMSRGTAFPISANVTDFQRSVKSPIQGTRPITPSNVPLCPALSGKAAPAGHWHPLLHMAPRASVFGESQSVQSPLAAAVPGGREHRWSLVPNKTPSPRADPSPLLSPTCIVSADPRPGGLRSRSLGFRSSSSSLSAVQLAHRAPGDGGVTSREPGVPGSAVEVGEGWYSPSSLSRASGCGSSYKRSGCAEHQDSAPHHPLMPGLVFLQEAGSPGDLSVVRAQRG